MYRSESIHCIYTIIYACPIITLHISPNDNRHTDRLLTRTDLFCLHISEYYLNV